MKAPRSPVTPGPSIPSPRPTPLGTATFSPMSKQGKLGFAKTRTVTGMSHGKTKKA